MIDFVLPFTEGTSTGKHFGRHFQIEYIIEKNVYTIKDLGNGYGAFVRVDFPQVLRDNNLLSAGDSFIVVNLIEDTPAVSDRPEAPVSPASPGPVPNKLRLKLFSGPSSGEV